MSDIALSGRALGTLLYQSPDSPDCARLLAALADAGWAAEWPLQHPQLTTIAQRMAAALSQPTETLNSAYQRLFIGPDALPAPPWGSVYMDRESVLFGDSLLELRRWMRQHSIRWQTTFNQPEDHIGTLLLLAAWLAERQQRPQLETLLACHLLPWSDRFLWRLIHYGGNDFYRQLAELTRITLNHWQEDLAIRPVARTLYY